MARTLMCLLLLFLALLTHHQGKGSSPSQLLLTPSPWPSQFHSLLFINTSAGALQAVDLWYDWPHGRNFNIIHHQLHNVLHDLEWTNGTSFYYDLDAQTCITLNFDVGILRPEWMDNATYLGQQEIDGFTCNVWTKADFIVYWEDVETTRPVHWVFSSGTSVHVMTFEEGAVLEDSEWQAPAYCFTGQNVERPVISLTEGAVRDPLERWLQELEISVGVVPSQSPSTVKS